MKRLVKKCMDVCRDIKLLYVEDSEESRYYSLEILKKFFTDISIATDGIEGLEKFEHGAFDIVLTDINMPRMDGIKMAQKIKEIDNSVPVIILSAFKEEHYFISSIAAGIDAYLFKPIVLAQLIETLLRVSEKISLQKKLKEYQRELELLNSKLEMKIDQRTQELEYRLYHDSLTHLGNHELMMKNFNIDSEETLFLIDIIGFKKFNDLYGLDVGNEILKQFAKKLLEFDTKEQYHIYRVYGDYYLLQIRSQSLLQAEFDEEIKRIKEYFSSVKIYLKELDDFIEIDVTIGVAFKEKNAFIKTDMALDYAKKENIHMAKYSLDIDTSQKHLEDLYWKKEIKLALLHDNIIPVYQGIVDNEQRVVKYETLIRLRQIKDGKEKLITPFFFLEAAMNTQQYSELTKRMIQKSFEFMQDKDVDFSVNLSFEDFADPERIIYLHEQIDKYNIAHKVVFEILESEVVSDYELVIDVLKDFKLKGVRIAIDDFGSGYSNFEHILKLQPDFIKIDASLIKNILVDERTATLVKAIVDFSKELGMRVIAEYVETKEIYELLKTYGHL